MNKLSVVVITYNEEANLPRCLASVSFADELIVVDSNSTDSTREIAAEYGAIVYRYDWRGYGPAKQEGTNRATGEWILSLDADEELSSKLAGEIREVLTGDHRESAFEMPRRTQFLGRWIYHCGWYPDYVLRLFRKSAGGFNEAAVHEQIKVSGAVGRLQGEILHYCYPDLDSYFVKLNRYTTLAAREEIARGRRSSLYDLLVRPCAAFIKHYLIRRGFLDGFEGFLVSVLSSGYVLVKYAKMRDLVRRKVKQP